MTFLGDKDVATTEIVPKSADADCKAQCFVQTGTGEVTIGGAVTSTVTFRFNAAYFQT